jgi:hypothetical protein
MIVREGGIVSNALLRHTDRLETDPSLQTFDGAGGAGLHAPFPQIPQIRRA